jgi:hypothetical protein
LRSQSASGNGGTGGMVSTANQPLSSSGTGTLQVTPGIHPGRHLPGGYIAPASE